MTTLIIIVAVLCAGAVITFIGTRLIERAHRPRGRFIDIGGFPQHVVEMEPRDTQDALPVVVLHGAGANRARRATCRAPPRHLRRPARPRL